MKRHISKMQQLVTGSTLALVLMLGISAQAQTERVLYSFSTGSDGQSPNAGLVMDAAGNQYGTTPAGGTSNAGTIFKLNKRGTETVLYNFTGGADGAHPFAPLIMDAVGNLYGTTSGGGASGSGTVFKLNKYGKETVLHSFTGTPDGGVPGAGLLMDASGNLYGTTYAGGTFNLGTIFKVNKHARETVLHNFSGRADGGNPVAGLIMDKVGNLYGATYRGGASDAGIVFKFSNFRHVTPLYTFTGGVDGGNPYHGKLVRDPKKGYLYGTTSAGGTSNLGTIFKVNLHGQETVLHSFIGGADGQYPYAGVVADAAGSLYGSTSQGGTSNHGTVFKLNKFGKETVLFNFTGGADGGSPYSALIMDARGNLYGTSSAGGASSLGTVFKVIPNRFAPVR